MNGLLAGLIASLWLGILTSISPCPLATNIAAISYIGKDVEHRKRVLLSGLLYTLGRALVYTVLGSLLVAGSTALPRVSMFLQNKMPIFVGPVLLITGVLLLGIVKLPFIGKGMSMEKQKKLSEMGFLGAFLLGALFALAFCPVSAALFFGNTLGLAMQHSSKILIPLTYGIGTAIPVIAFSFVIAFSVAALGNIFNKVAIFEKWARRISGIVFIGAGIYFILSHIFHLI